MNTFPSPVVLGTSYTTIAPGLQIVDYLVFANADTSDRTVTVTDAGGKVFLPAATVRASDVMLVPLPNGGFQFNGLQAKASVGAMITCWVRISS
jgi:hypothetical protein